MRKQGFIINPKGSVTLWVEKDGATDDGFYFEVINGSWRGRWLDTDDLLTNGCFKVAQRGDKDWQPATFRYTPPAMPSFSMLQYNEAIQWMQDYINNDPR